FLQAEDGIRDFHVTGVQTCALPIYIPDLASLIGQENTQVVRIFEFIFDDSSPLAILSASSNKGLTVRTELVARAGGMEIKLGHRSEERRVGKERRTRWSGERTEHRG